MQVYCRKESHACRLFCRKTYEWLEAGDAPDHTTVSSPALKAEFRHKYGDTACMLNICFQSVKANLFCHIAVVVSTAYENIMPPIVLDSTQPSTPSSSQTSDSEGKELLQRRPTIYQQQPPGLFFRGPITRFVRVLITGNYQACARYGGRAVGDPTTSGRNSQRRKQQ